MPNKRMLLGFISLLSLCITGCQLSFNTASGSSEKSSASNETSFSSSIESSNSSFEESSLSSFSSQEQSSSKSSSMSSSSSVNSSLSSSSSSAISSSASSSSSSSVPSSSSSSSSSNTEPNYVSFGIYTFNDTHGNVLDTPEKGISLAKTATVLKEASKDTNAVFISQGDMWQGSLESNYTSGKLVTEWMNSMNFVSMTVGNHEFDWGQDKIRENAAIAEFPILGINVLYKSNYERVDYLEPSTTFMRGDAKIGVIGAIGNCLNSISGNYVSDITFATGNALTELVKNESERLRNEEHCDFIIYSLHGSPTDDSSETYDVSLSKDGYVDLVLEGHSHQRYSYVDDGGIYHIQGKSSNRDVWYIPVELELTSGYINVNQPTVYNFSYETSPYKNVSDDPETTAILEKYYDQYSAVYKELGVVSEYKNPNALRNKIAELYYEKGYEKWGDDYDICLGGGYLSCRNNGFGPGLITYGDLVDNFPFNNDIVLCAILGRNFKFTQWVQGSSNYFVTWANNNPIRFEDVNNEEYYYLVTDTYSTDYYSNIVTIIDVYGENIYARDLLADYISEGNWEDVTETHEGTITDPKTIEEARAQALLYTNADESTPYYFKGVVCTLATELGSSKDMKNVYVKDADKNNATQIYFLKKYQGASVEANWTSVDELKIGDVLVFYGRPFYYNSKTIEFSSGAYVYSINGKLTELSE